MFIPISKNKEDLVKLQAGDSLCVVLPNLDDVDLKKFSFVKNVLGENLVYARPKSFRKHVKEIISEMINNDMKESEVYTYGNQASERATIHDVANDFNMKLDVNIDAENYKFIISKSLRRVTGGQRSTPNWFYELKNEGDKHIAKPKKMVFSQFRAKCYRLAKKKNVKLSVYRDEENNFVVEYRGKTAEQPESLQKRFNRFLDTLSVGDEIAVPDEFSNESERYLRVLCAQHHNPIKYRQGILVYPTTSGTPATTLAHIDNHGNFILHGENLGPRTDRWITLKLKPLGLTLEDIK